MIIFLIVLSFVVVGVLTFSAGAWLLFGGHDPYENVPPPYKASKQEKRERKPIHERLGCIQEKDVWQIKPTPT
jgi:hypothetical protein